MSQNHRIQIVHSRKTEFSTESKRIGRSPETILLLDCESIGERILKSLNGATAGRLRSPVLNQPVVSTGQLPINASLRSHLLSVGRIMSQFDQKAIGRAAMNSKRQSLRLSIERSQKR